MGMFAPEMCNVELLDAEMAFRLFKKNKNQPVRVDAANRMTLYTLY